jgi:Ca-activated chloride channel family protein
MQVAFPVLPITTDYSVASLQSTLKWYLLKELPRSGHKAVFHYFDEQNSKLLILISDGEDHSEGAQAAAEEANKQE